VNKKITRIHLPHIIMTTVLNNIRDSLFAAEKSLFRIV